MRRRCPMRRPGLSPLIAVLLLAACTPGPAGSALDGRQPASAPPAAAGPSNAAHAAASAAASPQAFGALVPTSLEIPPGTHAAPFDQPRNLNLPAGFRAQLFASGLTNPRMMAFDDNGVLHVTQTSDGSVVALPDRDGDGVADAVVTVHTGLNRPHGLAFRDGWLYVADTDGVVRLRGTADDLARPQRESVVEGIPSGAGHFTRTLGFGPDGGMYVSVGSSCNVCLERDPRRGACDGVAAPRAEMQAHAAPLGLAFYPDANDVVVALHGSWNRSVPVPPHLAHILLHPDGNAEVENFATGWQLGISSDTRWGRVAGVVVGPDGSLYVSDDTAGAIYRFSR